MISDVVRDTTWMHSFEKSQARNLMQIISSLIDDTLHLFVLKAIRAKQLLKVVLTEGFEGTAVEFILTWGSLIKYLVAAPRFVVLFLTLFTEHMTDIVAVTFLEFGSIHFLSECLLPKSVSLIHG